MNDFAMTDGFDWELSTDVNGFIDLVPICNHEVVSGLIYTRLMHELDYDLLESDQVIPDLKTQMVRDVVINTFGVTDVDMSNFNPSPSGNNFDFGQICPVIDCDNSQNC